MRIFPRTHVRKHELGLVFRRGDYVGVLTPGRHKVPGLFGALRGVTVRTIDRSERRFTHPKLDFMLEDPAFRALVHVAEVGDTECATVFRDGRLAHVLGVGRHVLFRAPGEDTTEIEVHDRTAVEFRHAKLDALLRPDALGSYLDVVAPGPGRESIVFVDGQVHRRVREGRFVHWTFGDRVFVRHVDLREQVLDVAGQEIMTRDKVTLRMNLVVSFRVVDPVVAVTKVADHAQALYRDAQLALRAAIGTRTLDALLANKEATGEEVRAVLATRGEGLGLAVDAVGIRDLILPGEMKEILNQVIAAQKQAEANVVRRREETAAARSQANTAKLLADNPTLARLKELELLQEVLAGVDATFVFGQGGDVLGQLEKLIARKPD